MEMKNKCLFLYIIYDIYNSKYFMLIWTLKTLNSLTGNANLLFYTQTS